MIGFDELVRREAAGQLVIGVERSFARRFYTDVSLREIKARTGESHFFEKMIVYLAFWGGPLVLLTSFVQAVWLLGWWSAMFIVIGAILWLCFLENSVKANTGMRFISLVIVACGVGIVLTDGSTRLLLGLTLMYAAALWLSRLLYVSANFFLRGFVLRNQEAWKWLHKQMVIRETG